MVTYSGNQFYGGRRYDGLSTSLVLYTIASSSGACHATKFDPTSYTNRIKRLDEGNDREDVNSETTSIKNGKSVNPGHTS